MFLEALRGTGRQEKLSHSSESRSFISSDTSELERRSRALNSRNEADETLTRSWRESHRPRSQSIGKGCFSTWAFRRHREEFKMSVFNGSVLLFLCENGESSMLTFETDLLAARGFLSFH